MSSTGLFYLFLFTLRLNKTYMYSFKKNMNHISELLNIGKNLHRCL